jgi:membrane protease YdiL (CAAX protease family)
LNYRNPVALIAIAAPTVSATILTAAWQGKTGLRELYSRLAQWRFGLRWYALILLGIPFLGWLTTLVAGANPVYVLSTPAFAISILLNLMYTGPLCEELGWRGYALPRLLRQFNPLVASLILGLFWGVWHLPSFYISSLVQSSLSLPAFLLFGLFTSILMTWIFRHTGGSVLAAVLFHYTVNVSLSIIGAPLVAFGLVLMVFAVLVVAFDKRLGWFIKSQAM